MLANGVADSWFREWQESQRPELDGTYENVTYVSRKRDIVYRPGREFKAAYLRFSLEWRCRKASERPVLCKTRGCRYEWGRYIASLQSANLATVLTAKS